MCNFNLVPTLEPFFLPNQKQNSHLLLDKHKYETFIFHSIRELVIPCLHEMEFEEHLHIMTRTAKTIANR